jgi:molybdate transport system substrate-binding protein
VRSPVRWRLHIAALLLIVPTIVFGFTGAAGAGSARSGKTSVGLIVLAASSLTDVFPRIDAGNKYSFGGSDTLATQITQGAPADVFAAASPKYPEQLFQKGLVLKPVVFATNKLVVVTPSSNPAGIGSVYDLCKSGVKIDIGDKAVPIGSYTRQMLTNLGLQCALTHVVSNEQNVRDILTKVSLGEADAGFVYITDAKTVAGKVKTIFLPGWAQPHVKYEIAVLKSSSNQPAAAAFIAKVLSKSGQKLLKAAGFGGPKGTVKK